MRQLLVLLRVDEYMTNSGSYGYSILCLVRPQTLGKLRMGMGLIFFVVIVVFVRATGRRLVDNIPNPLFSDLKQGRSIGHTW